MKKPNHQQIIIYITWILAGFLALGTFLDAISNAISIITPLTTYIGTAALLTILLIAYYTLKYKPIDWVTQDQQVIRIRKLRLGIFLPIFGMIVLLWMPRLLEAAAVVSSTPKLLPPSGVEETLILIVEFQLAEGIVDVDIHNEVRESIEQAIKAAGVTNIRVETIGREVRIDEIEEIRKLGEEYDADIIIWGQDTGVRVNVHFMNLQLETTSELVETKRLQIANPSAYARYVTQDLPASLTLLTSSSIAESFVTLKDYDRALVFFLVAVNVPYTDNFIELVANAYFNIGYIYQYQLADKRLAIAAYTLAIGESPDFAEAYRNRGFAYKDIGNLSKSIDDLRVYLGLRPDINDKAIIEVLITQMEDELNGN